MVKNFWLASFAINFFFLKEKKYKMNLRRSRRSYSNPIATVEGGAFCSRDRLETEELN